MTVIIITAYIFNCHMLCICKVNLAKKGWFPRPVMQISDEPTPERTAHWNAFFRHDEYGSPANILAVPLDGADRTDGSRQSWKYSVSYPSNRSATFVLPCPSLPVDIDENIVLQRLPGLPRQSFRGLFFRNVEEQRMATFKLLRQRNYEERYSDEWK